MRHLTSLCIAALIVGTASVASARGTVLTIDGADVYVDLGSDDGVAVGSQLTLHHVIEVTHPVTKKKVRDTFPLGALQVVKIGRAVAVARAPGELARRVAVGDEVSLASAPVDAVDPWKNGTPGSAGAAAAELRESADQARAAAAARVDVETAVRDAWRRTLGRPLSERVEVWRGLREARDIGFYSAVIDQELANLERQIAEDEARRAVPEEDRVAVAAIERLQAVGAATSVEGALAYDPPLRAYEGSPLELAFTIVRPSEVARAWVYLRSGDDAGYQRVELRHDGDGYLRATVPGELAVPPTVDYFVETLASGAAAPVAAIGEAARPRRIAIDTSVEPEPPSIEGRSRVTLLLDYVDFDGLGGDKDQYVHGEIDFLYRFFQPIYSLRLGFGTMGGVGGPKDVIDETPDCVQDGVYMCRKVGYNYAYAELEERVGEWFAIMLRAQWGSAYRDRAPDEGADREFFSAFGVRGRLRFGSELGSNLVLGAGATRHIGKLYEGAFTWDVVPRFPIVLAVQVTDQPVIEDYGVRLLADVGWRNFDWMYPSVRVAYQARDIDHAGLSAGMAVNFDW